MARYAAWERYMKRASAQLSRACAEKASAMSGEETAVKDIRDLAGAMKELTALRTALEPQEDTAQSSIQITFDREGEGWKH